MATVTRVNPVAVTNGFALTGKELTIFTVDYIADVSTKTGPESFLANVLKVIQKRANILIAGPLFDTGSQQTFVVEGAFPGSTFVAEDGTTGLSFFAALEEDIQDMPASARDSVTTTSMTVTEKTLAIPTV